MMSLILQYTIVLILTSILVKIFSANWKFYSLSWRLPGPIALPILGNSLTLVGSTEDIFKKLCSVIPKYPSPMRFWLGTRFVIIFHEAEQIEKLIMSSKLVHKDDGYQILQKVVGDGLISSSGSKWKSDRKILKPVLSIKNYEKFSNVTLNHSKSFIEIIEEQVDKPAFDIGKYMHRCYSDLVIETLFGENVQAQRGKLDNFIHAIVRIYKLLFVQLVYTIFRNDFIFGLTPFGKIFTQDVKQFRKLFGNLIDSTKMKREIRKADGFAEPLCFFDNILDLAEYDQSFSDSENLIDHASTLFNATEDTLASISSFMLTICGMYPQYQEKIYQEIHSELGTDPENVTPESVQKLQYLDMCLKEILRLFPIAPFIMRKTTEDVQIDKWYIPKECSVLLSMITIHKDPKHWERPNEFYPDHFLPEAVEKRHPYAYLPFSAGPRGCLGKTYAMQTMKITLALFFQKFRVLPGGSFDHMKLRSDISVRLIGGHYIRITKRN